MTDPSSHSQTVASTRLLQALSVPRTGRIYDLDAGRFAGMPIWEGHPPWQLLGYRSPQGLRVEGDQEWLAPANNEAGIGIMSDLLIAGMHSGAHIDALAHITCGEDAHWYAGDSANDKLGDFGPLSHDVRLAHIATRQFESGFVQSKYALRIPRDDAFCANP